MRRKKRTIWHRSLAVMRQHSYTSDTAIYSVSWILFCRFFGFLLFLVLNILFSVVSVSAHKNANVSLSLAFLYKLVEVSLLHIKVVVDCVKWTTCGLVTLVWWLVAGVLSCTVYMYNTLNWMFCVLSNYCLIFLYTCSISGKLFLFITGVLWVLQRPRRRISSG